jgi:small-conductance mechanosensitive channel
MIENGEAWGVLRVLFWKDVLLVFGAFVLFRVAIYAAQRVLVGAAERASPRYRLSVLRAMPYAKILIGLAAASVIVPLMVEPTLRNVMTLLGTVGLALAFTLKDYGSSLVAGLTTVLENTYQPGDWIQVGADYGEVKSIGPRATRIVTSDDTEVVIPHTRLWSTSIHNATSGSRSLLCVADFYLHPEHDAAAARNTLERVAETSSFRAEESPVAVIVLEKPWGTHYRLKSTARDSREQFQFVTDLTVRGKEALRSLGIRFAQAGFAETPR